MGPPKSLRLAKRMHLQAWPGSHAITLKSEKIKTLFPNKQVFYQKEVIAAREGEGAFRKQHKT